MVVPVPQTGNTGRGSGLDGHGGGHYENWELKVRTSYTCVEHLAEQIGVERQRKLTMTFCTNFPDKFYNSGLK